MFENSGCFRLEFLKVWNLENGDSLATLIVEGRFSLVISLAGCAGYFN